MGKKHRRKKSLWIILWILVGGLLVLGIPMLFNEAYKFGLSYTPLHTIVWDRKDVLTYYGSLVGTVGTIIGVYFSIKAAYVTEKREVAN